MRRVLWQTYYQFDKDNAWVVSGYIAYMGLFALFPFVIFLLALAGFLGQGEAAAEAIELSMELLPPDVASALRPAVAEVVGAPHAGLMTFSILVTLWASSSGLESLRHALNLAYRVSDAPAFWRTRLESLLLTVVAAVVVIVVMVLLVVLPLVLEAFRFILQQPRLGERLLTGPREPIGFVLLLALLVALYRLLPNARLRPMEILPGAVVAWLLWLLTVWGLHLLSAQRAQLQCYLRQPRWHRGDLVLLLYLRSALHLRGRAEQRPEAPPRKPQRLNVEAALWPFDGRARVTRMPVARRPCLIRSRIQ